MALLAKIVEFRPAAVERSELMPIAAAAKRLGMTRHGVINAMNRGKLHEFIDDQASYHARRLLLRAEVEAWAAERVAGAVENVEE